VSAATVPAGEPRTLAPFGRRLGEVSANEAIGAYRLVTVDDPGGPADPRPGQFYMLATAAGWSGADGERPYLPRAFSFARAREGRLGFLLEGVGPGTDRLASLHPGEEVWLTGPLGVGFAPPAGGASRLLVAGGIGVAPVLALAEELGGDAPVMLGFRSGAHAEAAALFPGEVSLATDDGSAGVRALVTELLREELDRDSGTVYACGPPPMLEAVRALCAECSAPAQLALESGMACGYGACYGCVVPTVHGYMRLCVDGPVLDAALLEAVTHPGADH